jgi:hypothetical protein
MNELQMTELPDGSGCFTATIMSEQEAMALPLKERPLNHRISSEIYHGVFEAIGEASMCWNPRPSNEVFASEQASDVAVRLCFKIANEVENKTARLQDAVDAAVDLLDDAGPGTVDQKLARWHEARRALSGGEPASPMPATTSAEVPK